MKRPAAERFAEKYRVDQASGCWLWTAALNEDGGYGVIWGGSKLMLAHRLSWNIHKGDIPPGLFVLHKCDVPQCVNPDHLFVGTDQDNKIDMIQKGRGSSQTHPEKFRGELNGRAKLTETEVVAIKDALSSGVRGRVLARQYGVTDSMISHIKHNRGWVHTKGATT